MKGKSVLWFLLLLGLESCTKHGVLTEVHNSDSLVSVLDEQGFSGYTYAILADDRLVTTGGHGTIRGSPARPHTLLPMVGLSKLLTAVAVMQLVEDGDLNLSDKVFGDDGVLYYVRPEHGSHQDHRINNITVRDLLYHTSGWDERQGPLYDPMLNAFYVRNGYNVVDISREMDVYGILSYVDIVRFVITQPLHHDPGTKRIPSNFGYTVLGRIIEELTDLPYEDYVKANILEPCGMWHTRIGASHSNTYQGRQAFGKTTAATEENRGRPPKIGYIPLDSKRTKSLFDIVPPIVLDACLGWHSNVYDLSRLYTALFLDPYVADILDPSTVEGIFVEAGYNPVPDEEPWDGMGLSWSYDDQMWYKAFHPDIGMQVLFYNQEAPFWSNADAATVTSDITVLVFGVTDSQTEIITDLMTWTKNGRALTQLPLLPSIIHQDLADVNIKTSDQHYLVATDLGEHRLLRYLYALRLADFTPMWLSGYQQQGHTKFVVLSQRCAVNTIDCNFGVLEDTDKNALISEIMQIMHSYEVIFVHSFQSASHDGGLNHVAILRKSANPNITSTAPRFGFASDLDSYSRTLDQALADNFLPVIQSVDVYNKSLKVSYLIKKNINPSGTDDVITFFDLSLADLKEAVEENGRKHYVLGYVDSFVAHGQTRFSAVFHKHRHREDMYLTHTQIPANLLQSDLVTWQKSDYLPSIITGYHHEENSYFIVVYHRV